MNFGRESVIHGVHCKFLFMKMKHVVQHYEYVGTVIVVIPDFEIKIMVFRYFYGWLLTF